MEEVSPSTDFNLVGDKMELVISDIVIITKKEKAPPNYIPVEPPLGEGGRLSFTKRYFAYSREIPNPRWGRVAVTDIKVLSSTQAAPVSYRSLSETLDDNSKPFSSKLVVIKVIPYDEAIEAVTDLVILSGSKKDQVPTGYRRLPEVNGYSICFQVSKLTKKNPPQMSGVSPGSQMTRPRGQTKAPSEVPTYEKQVSRKARSAIDGLSFKVAEQNESYVNQFLLPELKLLTLDEIENKFKFDWKLEELAQQA